MSLYSDLLAAGLPVVSATDGAQATFSRTLEDQEMETYLNILYPNRAVERADFADARQMLKDQYQAAVDRLLQIENAVNPTNAQVIAAIKDIAHYERIIARILARII